MLMSALRRSAPLAALALLLPLVVPSGTSAQEEDEAPETRIIAVTHMKIPFADRATVLPFMREYFLPGGQVNPNVISQRVLMHYYGSDARDVVVVTEYEDLAALEAPCGQPCDDYEERNPPPEEGEEGYEEYEEAQDLFAKYFAHHHDEIFVAPMELSKIEGTVHGPIGLPEEEMEDEME